MELKSSVSEKKTQVCWYFFMKFGSYKSALICVNVTSYELKWDYMDI